MRLRAGGVGDAGLVEEELHAGQVVILGYDLETIHSDPVNDHRFQG